MKTKSILWLCLGLFLLAVPAVQTSAFDDEVEIELLEVSGFLPGDNPLDNCIKELLLPTGLYLYSSIYTDGTTESEKIIIY